MPISAAEATAEIFVTAFKTLNLLRPGFELAGAPGRRARAGPVLAGAFSGGAAGAGRLERRRLGAADRQRPVAGVGGLAALGAAARLLAGGAKGGLCGGAAAGRHPAGGPAGGGGPGPSAGRSFPALVRPHPPPAALHAGDVSGLKLLKKEILPRNPEILNDIGDDSSRHVSRMPGERDQPVRLEWVGVMVMTAGGANQPAAQFAETAFQLAAVASWILAHVRRSE